MWKFKESPTIEIAEASEEEAPIAVSWPAVTDTSAYQYLAYSAVGCGDLDGRQFTRWYNGRHWLRLTEGSADEYRPAGRSPALTGASFEAGFPQGRGYNILDLNSLSPGDYKEAKADPTERFVTINRNGRDEAMEILKTASKKLLCVNGVLYVACAQPGVCLELANPQSLETNVLHVDTRSKIVDGKEYLSRHTLVFGLHEWDDVTDIVVRGSSDRENTRSKLDSLRPTVHLPESIDPDILTVRTADTFVKHFILDSYPKTITLQKYFDLNDASAKEAFLREVLAEKRDGWEAAGLPVQLLDLADETFANASIELGANLSLPKPF
jgi:hypothetical protein